MQDFCLEASPPKCWTFGVGPVARKKLRNFQFAGGVLGAPAEAERILGAHVQFTGKQTAGCHGERLTNATKRARRVRWLPLRQEQNSSRFLGTGVATLPSPLAKMMTLALLPPGGKTQCRTMTP